MLNSPGVKVPVLENWNEQRDKLKTLFPALTDQDLQDEEGKRDEMFTRVQVKPGKSNEEMGLILSALLPSRKLKNR
jgi:hypothetical protein